MSFTVHNIQNKSWKLLFHFKGCGTGSIGSLAVQPWPLMDHSFVVNGRGWVKISELKKTWYSASSGPVPLYAHVSHAPHPYSQKCDR